MELFIATGKPTTRQLEMFGVCTTGDTAHIDAIFKFLPHTRQHGCFLLDKGTQFQSVVYTTHEWSCL